MRGSARGRDERAGGQDTRARPGAHRVDGQRPSTHFPPFSFMQSPESETFDSVHWETVPSTSSPSLAAVSAPEEEDLDPGRLFAERLHLEDAAHAAGGESSSKWKGWLSVRIVDYKKELENGKESYVTYGVEMKVRGRCPRSSSVRVASETSGAAISLADKLLSCPLVPLPWTILLFSLLCRPSLGYRLTSRRSLRLGPRSAADSRILSSSTIILSKTSRRASSRLYRTSTDLVRASRWVRKWGAWGARACYMAESRAD